MKLLSSGVCFALLTLPTLADAQRVTTVARRGDGQAVIIRFASELDGNVDLTRFRLMDVTTGRDIPLAGVRDTSHVTCPRGDDNRLCLPLATGTTPLEDTHEYVLRMHEVKMLDGKLPPSLVSLPPVKGKIDDEREVIDGAKSTQMVFASYLRDLGGDTVADPEILVNGQRVTVLSERKVKEPKCYRQSGFDFSCEIDRRLQNGDMVTFRLVDRRNPAVVVDTTFGTFKVDRPVPEKEADARLRLKASYARQNGDATGSLALLVRDCRLATGVQICPEIRFGALDQPLEGWIRPYADLLLTTEENGHYDLGLQFQAYLYDVPVFNMVDFRITPRRESDQKGALSHWMYLDAEARFYLTGLQSGRVLGGFYNVTPRLGYERGATDEQPKEPRIEAADPERLKGGALFVVNWPKGALSFLPNGGNLKADWTAYSIREDPGYADPPEGWLHYVTAAATFNIRPNVGLSLTRRSGRQAPQFDHLSTFELGFTFLQ